MFGQFQPMDRSSQLAWLVVEKLAGRGGNFSLVLRRFLQKFEPLNLSNFGRAVKECLPGVSEDEIDALSQRLDEDYDGMLQLDDLCRLFLNMKRDTVLPGRNTILTDANEDEARMNVFFDKLHGRLSTLSTEQHARIPSSRRLPARKNHLLKALGLRMLRKAFDGVRRSTLVKLTPTEMGEAVNQFRTPGQGLLIDQNDTDQLWKVCDCGDPEIFIELYRSHLKKERKIRSVQEVCEKKNKMNRTDGRKYTHALPDDCDAILKLRYKQSRTLVSPPVGFGKLELAKAVAKSFKAPSFGLELEHVFGYTPDLAGPNLAAARDKIVYNSAAVAVATGSRGADQVFFRGHSDDVACIAVDSQGLLGATGQVASETTQPYACVWAVEDGRELRKFGGDGSIQRLVCALTFFRDGSHLAVVSGDDRHTLYVYDLRREDTEPVVVAPCKSGVKPPAVWAVCAAPQATCEIFGHDHVLVTLGVGHLAFWLIDIPTKKHIGGRHSLLFSKKLPTYQNRKAPSATHCCAFVPNDDAVITGASDGKVYVWRDYTIAYCFDAHRGPTRAMAHASTWLYTGGQDGLVKRWDLVRGKYRAVVDSYHSTSNPHAKHAAKENHARHQTRNFKGPTAFESMRRTGDRGVSDLIVDPRDESRAICGFAFGEIAVVDVDRKETVRVVQRAHHASTSDVCAHPTERQIFATVGLDCLLCVWNADKKSLVASTSLCAAGMAVAMNETYIAVGLATGAVSVHDQNNLASTVMTANVSSQPLSQVRFSPDNTRIAVGSHDCSVYILDASTLAVRRKLGGHSSYVTHLDFSSDSKLLQSSCGGYEILYWDVSRGKQIKSSHDSIESDTDWHEWTLTLGYPVMGIFEPDSDGTDVNCAHRAAASSNRKEDLIVTGDDSGYVNVYNAPVVCRHAAHFQYTGHSSHCVGARFLKGGDRVVTTGGRDAAVFVWRVVPVGTSSHDHKLIQPPIARPAWIKGCDMTSSTDILRKPSKIL